MVGNGGGSYTSLVHEVVALKVKYKTRFDLNTCTLFNSKKRSDILQFIQIAEKLSFF